MAERRTIVTRGGHPQRKTRARVRARARAREGAVMLVVLLILLVATASAAVSVSNTQTELQSAGNERVAMQTRYVAEAAITSSLAWVDKIQERFHGVLRPAAGNELAFYPEPEIAPGKLIGMATIENVAAEQKNNTEVAVLSDAVPYVSAGTGGSGGAGGTVAAGTGGAGGSAGSPAPTSDTTGSFGPEQSYGLTPQAFIVHFTDCVKAPGALAPGEDLREGALGPMAYHCVVTARGRLEPAGGGQTADWTFGSGGKNFSQRVFASAHDARATIISPLTMPE